MNNYFTSDTHFFHENILKYCDRPFDDTSHMNEDIIERWNAVVSPDDTVWHLGDFAFKTGQKREEVQKILARLNGDIILIKGNHENPKHLPHFDFKMVLEYTTLTLGDKRFKLAHFPYPWGRTAKDLRERPSCKTEPENDPNTGEMYPLLCGHVHETWAMEKGCLNVGWDIWKRPLSEAEVLRLYEGTHGFQELTGLGDLIKKVVDKIPD
jgi:calcineurin-like phosphoesterase family protein